MSNRDTRDLEIQNLPPSYADLSVSTIVGPEVTEKQDSVCIEEPLEIVVQFGEPVSEFTLSITMRTPGYDHDLAIGFLYGEGIIQSSQDLLAVEHCGPPSPDKGFQNVLKLTLHPRCKFNPELLDRHFYTTSSCGVCGKTSIEAVNVRIPPQTTESDLAITADVLRALPDELRGQQREFQRTGGSHAAALFRSSGEIVLVREDVGRHNAVDKLIGASLQQSQLELRRSALFLSGRASFELIQKAAIAGIPFVAAIGPPSNLAVELADQESMTLVGFLSSEKFNIYCGPDRVTIH